MAISLTVNGTTRSVEAEPDTPLLYVLRNDFEREIRLRSCAMRRLRGAHQRRGRPLLRDADREPQY